MYVDTIVWSSRMYTKYLVCVAALRFNTSFNCYFRTFIVGFCFLFICECLTGTKFSSNIFYTIKNCGISRDKELVKLKIWNSIGIISFRILIIDFFIWSLKYLFLIWFYTYGALTIIFWRTLFISFLWSQGHYRTFRSYHCCWEARLFLFHPVHKKSYFLGLSTHLANWHCFRALWF